MRLLRASICFILFITKVSQVHATTNSRYFVHLKDKGVSSTEINTSDYLSPKALLRRAKHCIPFHETDLPVYKPYIQAIENTGACVIKISKWLNLIAIECDETSLTKIDQFDFVKHTEPVYPVKSVLTNTSANTIREIDTTTTSENQLSMLGLDQLHANRITGEGMIITFLDAGFTSVNTLSAYEHVYKNNRIIATRNFVDPSKNVYDLGGEGEHGSRVFSITAAYMPNRFFGSAYQASFILAVTEDMFNESSLEEMNWAMAAEWADSIGTDIINSSLGYFTHFTQGQGYTYADMDGNTTIVTKAAQMAASKGILVVSSVGNEGDKEWYYLIAPADGDRVMAAGGVDAHGAYIDYSSKGPSSDGRIKPDVSARAHATIQIGSNGHIIWGNGTSFSAPLLSGLAACLWSCNPSLSNMELFHIIKVSANNYPHPNNYTGYGIPNAVLAYEIITGKKLDKPKVKPGQLLIYPNPAIKKRVTVAIDNTSGMTRNFILHLTDFSGKSLLKQKLETRERYFEIPLNLETYMSYNGLFVIQLFDENGLLIEQKKLLTD